MANQPYNNSNSEQTTLIIHLNDGSELTYGVTMAQKEDFEQTLRDRVLNWRNTANANFVFFGVLSDRTVYINSAFLLKITFAADLSMEATNIEYRDNFNVLPIEATTEHGYVKERFEEDILIPQLIIKLSGNVNGSDVVTYNSLVEGDLGFFDLEVSDVDSEMSEYLELTDSDGDSNFIAVRQIICMEGESAIFEEKDN
jgi:hypothetical protein